MASAERKQKDQQIQDKNLFAVLGAGEQQAETDAFQCGRCKQVPKIAYKVFFSILKFTAAQNCISTSADSLCR